MFKAMGSMASMGRDGNIYMQQEATARITLAVLCFYVREFNRGIPVVRRASLPVNGYSRRPILSNSSEAQGFNEYAATTRSHQPNNIALEIGCLKISFAQRTSVSRKTRA